MELWSGSEREAVEHSLKGQSEKKPSYYTHGMHALCEFSDLFTVLLWAIDFKCIHICMYIYVYICIGEMCFVAVFATFTIIIQGEQTLQQNTSHLIWKFIRFYIQMAMHFSNGNVQSGNAIRNSNGLFVLFGINV